MQVIGVSMLAICAGVVAAKSMTLTVALIAVALLFLYVWVARTHPRAAVIAMLASLALIPVYAVPMFRSFSPEPTAAAALILTLALFRAGEGLRLTVVDLTFWATCGAMVLAAFVGPHSLLSTESELFLWIPPYLAGRAVCKRRNGTEALATSAAVAGLIALPFIAYETVNGHNVFFSLARAGTSLTKLWAHPDFRPGGLLRSQGAFGHPLSMALIVSSCAIFALALAVRASSRRARIGWLLAAAALTIGQYTSHERSGWTVLISGLLIFAITAIPPQTRIRNALAVAAVAIPLSLLAVSASHPANGAAVAARASSSADRVNLWKHALEPGALALVGLPETSSFNHFANAIHPGQVAIDSGFLQIGDVYGLIAFAALFTVVIAVISTAIAVRGTWAAVVPAVALVDLISLTVIGFQTQIPIFVWLVIGGVSGVQLRHRATQSSSASRPPSTRSV
jgi:hypothetical protein